MKRKGRMNRNRRAVAAAVLFALLSFLAAPHLNAACAQAQSSTRTVRVGWYESPFNRTDEFGRRSGYAYEYLQKIAAYTGWTYEYVEGNWSALMEMLMDGRIDLLSDVSYTEERSEHILYSSLPMGEEAYYLFISPDNTEITQEDYATLNGKRIGTNRSSIQIGLFRDWAEANGVRAELVELEGTEKENLEALTEGDIDVYLTPDAFADEECTVPVCRIGSSEFFFAVGNDHPDLLTELNAAMNRIRDENPYFDKELYARYLQSPVVDRYLSAEEREWLSDHGPILVGYQDNYLAFCAKDPKTGELTGALKDYLRIASECFENAEPEFTAIAYPTAAAALNAMKNGETDCVFPANLTDYDGEVQGYFMTSPLMRTDISAVIRENDRESFVKQERVSVAVNAGNPNYDMFLTDHFPDWRAIYFQDTAECLRAIADGKADCLLISNYRYNNIADLCDRYKLTSVSTGVEMDYSFAVNREDTVLYSILSKMIGVVPDSTVNAALSYYFTEDAKNGISAQLRYNLGMAAGILCILVTAIALSVIILRSVRAGSADA